MEGGGVGDVTLTSLALAGGPLGPGANVPALSMPFCVTWDNSTLGPLGLSSHICKMGSVTPALSAHRAVLRAT